MNKKFSTLVAALLVSGGSFVVASQYMGSPLMSSPLAMAAAANLRATGAVAENYSIEAAKAESFDAAKIWTAAAANGGVTFATGNGSVLYKDGTKIKLAKQGTLEGAVFTVDAEGKLKVDDLFVLISESGLSLAATAGNGQHYVSAYSAADAVAGTASAGTYALAEDTRAITGVSSVNLISEYNAPEFASAAATANFDGGTRLSVIDFDGWFAVKLGNKQYLSVGTNGLEIVAAANEETCSVTFAADGGVSVGGTALYFDGGGNLTTVAGGNNKAYISNATWNNDMSSKVQKTTATALNNQYMFAGTLTTMADAVVLKYEAAVTNYSFGIDEAESFDGAVKATYTATGNTLAVGGKAIESTSGTVTADETGTAISLDTDGAIKIESGRYLVIDGGVLKSVTTVNTESKLYLYKDGVKETALPGTGTVEYVIANVQYGSEFTTDILTVTATEQDAVDATPGAEVPGMSNVNVDDEGKIIGSATDIPAPFIVGVGTDDPATTKYLAVENGKIVELDGEHAKKVEDNISAAWTLDNGKLMSVALDKAGVKKKYLGKNPNALRAAKPSASYVLADPSGAATAAVAGGALTIGGAAVAGGSTLTLSAAAVPALGFTTSLGQDLVTGEAASGPYLLSVRSGLFIENGGTTTQPNKASALWNVETQKLSDGSLYYSFYYMAGTTKNYLRVGGEISFKAYNDLKYNSGVALMVGDQYLTDDGAGSLTLGPTFSVIGFFEVGENLFKASELTTKRQTGFDMTIAVSDADDASTDIEGNPFTGILTPVNATYNTAGVGDDYFYLRNEDGNYIVQDLTATWSGSTEYTLNGTNVLSRGYKFKVVSEKDFKNVVLANPTKYNYIYSVSYSAAKSAANASELFIDVYDGSLTAPAFAGRLYVAELRNGTATSYLLTTTNGMNAGEHMPYVTFGGSSLLIMKDFLTAPQYYTVAEVDEKGAILKALGATSTTVADWYEKGAIQQDQPEGQFAAKKGATDDALVLSNRENPTAEITLDALYKTDKADIYKRRNQYYQIKAVAEHSANDGYEVWSNKQVRDEQYTLGFYSNVLGAAAYMSENHSNNHVIGLEKDIKDATSWKLTAYETSKAENGTKTDSIYVISDLNFWNKNKKGGADWDAKKDTLKVVAYSLTNTANNEVFGFVGGLYISDPNWLTNGVPRFAIKKKADGKYNLVKVKAGATNYEFDANKLYGGFSIAQGVVKEIGKYTLTENDLVVLDKVAAPEYVKLNMGDKIRIFREGSEASQLFEKGEFLGMENVFEFTKMAPAMYVDTAYYNRPDNNRWEYLLAVDPKQVTSETSCSDPTHGVHKADTVFGRFLVNLIDSAEVNNSLHNNKYINTEGYAKLGFVKGFHTNDTLVIQRAGAEKAAKADSLFLGSADPSFAKFAFRVVDNETGAFKIETAYRPYGTPNANLIKGYLKWMNGVVVVTNWENDADIFNLKATDENPTANEAIAAEGVQVIAGKGAVTVQGAAGKVITVANILGQTIANQVAASDNVTIAAPAGIVVVAVEGEATKVVVK